jgi:hypothetical protein
MNIKNTPLLLLLLCLGWATPSFASIFYVSPTGSDSNPGTSWAAAKQTIQPAIDAASAGDTVLVNDGTYALTAPITIASAIVLSSVNGASATIVDGQQGVRCVSITDTGAVLNGFTVRNGRARIGAGIFCSFGTVENCIVSNNIATGNDNGDGQGGGIYVNNGNVRFCNVHNNTANSVVADQYFNTAGGGGIYSVNGAIANSTIANKMFRDRELGDCTFLSVRRRNLFQPRRHHRWLHRQFQQRHGHGDGRIHCLQREWRRLQHFQWHHPAKHARLRQHFQCPQRLRGWRRRLVQWVKRSQLHYHEQFRQCPITLSPGPGRRDDVGL